MGRFPPLTELVIILRRSYMNGVAGRCVCVVGRIYKNIHRDRKEERKKERKKERFFKEKRSVQAGGWWTALEARGCGVRG